MEIKQIARQLAKPSIKDIMDLKEELRIKVDNFILSKLPGGVLAFNRKYPGRLKTHETIKIYGGVIRIEPSAPFVPGLDMEDLEAYTIFETTAFIKAYIKRQADIKKIESRLEERGPTCKANYLLGLGNCLDCKFLNLCSDSYYTSSGAWQQ